MVLFECGCGSMLKSIILVFGGMPSRHLDDRHVVVCGFWDGLLSRKGGNFAQNSGKFLSFVHCVNGFLLLSVINFLGLRWGLLF